MLLKHGADCTIQTTIQYMSLDTILSYTYWPAYMTPYEFAKLKLSYIKLQKKNEEGYKETVNLLEETMKDLTLFYKKSGLREIINQRLLSFYLRNDEQIINQLVDLQRENYI